MTKLIKAIVVLALLAAGIALVVHYSSRSNSKPAPAAAQTKSEAGRTGKDKPKEGIQPQEKYGFAPVGEGQ